MNSISINNIFNINVSKNNEKISVENMFTKVNEKEIFNKLKAKKIKKERELKSMYDNKYKDCLTKINISLNERENDIFYSIPYEHSKAHCDYSSLKCLEFISQKLIDNGFYAEIVSNTKIYISWRNITNDDIS